MSQGQRELWINKGQAAYIAGLSSQQFDNVIRPKLGEAAERRLGRVIEFDAQAVVAALLEYRKPKNAQAVDANGEVDPLLYGGDSPNLERYRKIKGDLAQIELEERRKTHVDVRVLDGIFVRFGSLLHRAGEVLQRRFGGDAVDIFNAALDEAERICLAEIRQHLVDFVIKHGGNTGKPGASDSAGNGTGKSKAPSDDAAVRGTGIDSSIGTVPG